MPPNTVLTAVGLVKKWNWRFSASTIPTTKSKIPTVTFSKPGTYTVDLTATGSDGTSTTKTKKIVVLAPASAQVQALSLATTQAPSNVLTKELVNAPVQALVAAFGFEENRGVVVKDNSGYRNLGTIKQAERVNNGHYGKGLKFDGINDWVTVKDSESLNLTSGFTLEAWVKPDSVRRSAVIVKQQQLDTVYDLYAYEDHDLPFSSFNDGFDHNPISGRELLPIKKWTHIAATFDGSYQQLYVNGILARRTQSQNGFIKPSEGVLRIGGNSVWGDFFKGYIDEVRIYNYALNDREIQKDLRTPISSP